MQVLYFADTRFPIERANGVQTMATCQALASRGHHVTLVVRPDSAPAPRDPFDFYGWPRSPRLTVRAVPAAGGRRARRLGFLLAALRIARSSPDAVVYTRDLGVAAFLLQLPFRRRPPVVYESHGIAPIVSAELPRLFGKPELAPAPRKIRRLDRRERRVWLHAHAYVTITRALLDELTTRYGPRPRVFVVPDGADDPGGSDPPPAAAASGGRPAVAGYSGHLYPWKGVDVFVRALAQAPALRGLIIGGHPQEEDRARVERLAADLGVSDRIEITGLVPRRDVARLLRRADILVLPNPASAISERYTSPLKLFEYLWADRPIVASDLASLREVLTAGAALFVPAGNPGALAAAMTALAADPPRARALAAAARALAPAYTWAARAARLEPALAAAATALRS